MKTKPKQFATIGCTNTDHDALSCNIATLPNGEKYPMTMWCGTCLAHYLKTSATSLEENETLVEWANRYIESKIIKNGEKK